MRTVRITALKAAKRRVVVDLDHDETLITVRAGAHYKLGGQVDDVVASHVLAETERVQWCSIAQKWEPA